MVDFSNESTISTPASGIVKMLILEARFNLMEAYEAYLTLDFAGIQPKREVVQARLWRLYKELEPSLRRNLEDPALVDLQAKIRDETPESLDLALTILNDHCDRIKLTRIDSRTEVDQTDIEAMNAMRGL